MRILDVGAGTGFLTVELAQRCGSDALIVAIDPWGDALNRLRRKLAYLGLTNVNVIEGDAATLDLPANSMDVIVSNLGINNFDQPETVLRKCFDVAKPNSKLILTTNLAGHMAEFYEVFRAVLIETGQVQQLPTLDRHIEHRGTVASVSQSVTQAGFVVDKVLTDSFRLRFANGSALLRHYFIRLGFWDGWKAVVLPNRLADTFLVLEQRLNEFAGAKGELALTIPLAYVEASKSLMVPYLR